MIKIVSFSMSGICYGQNCPFQQDWNVSWSKWSVSAKEYKEQTFQHGWNVTWSKWSLLAWLECVKVKIVSFSMAKMRQKKNEEKKCQKMAKKLSKNVRSCKNL
jgi:hypothetical protein